SHSTCVLYTAARRPSARHTMRPSGFRIIFSWATRRRSIPSSTRFSRLSITLKNSAASNTRPSGRRDSAAPTGRVEMQRVGYAVVGLGAISQQAVLPAFAHSRNAKLVAVVSGDRDKAKRLAGEF